MSMYILFTQVFHSLLKAHAVEARAVVKQALEILTPAMPGRMEDGNVSLYMHIHIKSVYTFISGYWATVNFTGELAQIFM